MAAEDDFGANLQPQGDLMKTLADPRVRNGLLSFAAQALTGSWGGPVSQFGQAMGHGLESAGNTEEIQKKHKEEQQKLAQQKDIAGEHNKTQLQIAQEHNQAMKDVATTRGTLANQRAQGPHDAALYNGIFNAALKDAMINPSIPQEDRVAYAHQQAAQAVLTHRSLGGGMSNTQTAPDGSTAQPTAKAPTGKKAAVKEPWDESKIDIEKFKTDPAYREKLSAMGYRSDVEKLMNKTGVGPLQSLLKMLRPKGATPENYTPSAGEVGQP
jgi:hypothetical protein